MSRMPLRPPMLNPEHHDGHERFVVGTCTSGAIIGDNCKAADCPEHGLFTSIHSVAKGMALAESQHLEEGFRRLERQTQMRQWKDSRGERVRLFPLTVAVGTTIIIFRDNMVLCHQRADNHFWGFPGGKMEPGENIEACAIRECFEETGFLVLPERLVCIDTDPKHGSIVEYPDNNSIQYCCFTFVCRIIGGDEKCSSESLSINWKRIDHLPEPFLFSHKLRLQNALDNTNVPIIR